MGMSIDKAISWLLSIAEYEGEEIQIYDEDVEAIKMGIETMRKYQRIDGIYYSWNTDKHAYYALKEIGEVLENGIDD